jgi:Sec-independent protein translocase protein TatA
VDQPSGMIGINSYSPSDEGLVDDTEREVLSSKLDDELKKHDQVEAQIKQLTEVARDIKTRVQAFREALEEVDKRTRKRAAQQKPDQLQAPDGASTPPPAQQDKSIWDDKQVLVLEVIDWLKQDITVKQKALLVLARHPDSTAKEAWRLLSDRYGQGQHPQNSVEGRISSLLGDAQIENSGGKYRLTDKGRKEVEKFFQGHG